MKQCPNCDIALDDEAVICPQCNMRVGTPPVKTTAASTPKPASITSDNTAHSGKVLAVKSDEPNPKTAIMNKYSRYSSLIIGACFILFIIAAIPLVHIGVPFQLLAAIPFLPIIIIPSIWFYYYSSGREGAYGWLKPIVSLFKVGLAVFAGIFILFGGCMLMLGGCL